MNKGFIDKESKDKRSKKFNRLAAIAFLTVIITGLLVLILMPENLELAILTTVLYVLAFQMFIFIWVFRLQYHLVPTLIKDDESMKLEEME